MRPRTLGTPVIVALGAVLLAAASAAAEDGGNVAQTGGGGATIGAVADTSGLPAPATTGGASGCTYELLNNPTTYHKEGPAPAPNADEYVQVCPGSPGATVVWVIPPAGAQAVPGALAQVTSLLPRPQPMMVPPDNDPHGWTYVQVPTWFWVPSSQWRPVSATATVTSGPFAVSATTTATPSQVTFSPGDGAGGVTCPGPGVAFDNSRPMSAQGRPCNTYTYVNSSSLSPNPSATWPAAMTIVWHVAWVASDGTGGALADLRTTTQIALSVGEVEALLTPNSQGGA